MGRCVRRCFLSASRNYAKLYSDTTTDSYYVQTRDIVPLKSDFKPAMKVLSRKPANKSTTPDVASGVEQLTIDDDEEDEEDGKQRPAMTSEERQAKAQKDREEKQRKYEEVRQRLFGAEKPAEKKASGVVTPLRPKNGDSRRQSRNRDIEDGRPTSAAGTKTRQLYDPNYTTKPDSPHVQKRDGQERSGQSTPNEQIPIRNPKGPDGSGRGGFGFVPREGPVT